MRSVATDRSDLTTASTAVTARIVDNNGPTTTLTDPGTPLRGSVTISATATDVSGVQSVAIQYAPAGTSTWTTICTDTSSSYSCSWNTTGVADGSYDLRARATDTLGKVSTSAVVASRAVDNVTSPVATDIQGTNGGTSGRLDTNDTIAFTYSQTILKTSISSAWTGTTLNLTVRVVDNGTSDYLDFYNAANTARINLTGSASGLNSKANHVGAAGARFTATATQASGVITVKLGTRTGTVNTGVTTATTMTWMPSDVGHQRGREGRAPDRGQRVRRGERGLLAMARLRRISSGGVLALAINALLALDRARHRVRRARRRRPPGPAARRPRAARWS